MFCASNDLAHVLQKPVCVAASTSKNLAHQPQYHIVWDEFQISILKDTFVQSPAAVDIATNYEARSSRECHTLDITYHPSGGPTCERKTTFTKKKKRVFHLRGAIRRQAALHCADDAECAAPNPRIALQNLRKQQRQLVSSLAVQA